MQADRMRDGGQSESSNAEAALLLARDEQRQDYCCRAQSSRGRAYCSTGNDFA